jgi:RimK family alpha-L-glutamate ligase
MKKRKILLIAEKGEMERYRTKRIIEEAEKAGCVIDLICSNETSILVSEAIFEGKAIDFKSYDVVYSLGNTFYHHYLLLLAESFGVFTWPNAKHLNLSDKFAEGIFFQSINIPIPRTILLSSKDEIRISKLVEKVGGFPCVLKKVTGSEGRYVDLANSSREVLDFVGRMPQGITGKKNILIQEYIAESKGTDFRVYCVGNEILGAIKRQSEKDFRANISLGGTAQKIELEEPLIEYSKKIMEKGELEFAGIDFIKSNKGYLAIEINTSADFQGFEKVTGVNVAGKIIDKLINQV